MKLKKRVTKQHN